MPLFKKFIYVIMIIIIMLLVAYITIYSYAIKTNDLYSLTKDYKEVIDLGLKDLKNSFALQFIESLSDTIVTIFTFNFKNIGSNEKYFFISIGLSSIPFLVTFFEFLTYRGFQAFKLKIKKAKANPFYYRDYVEANKDYGNDNIEETDMSMLPLLIPLRIMVLVLFLLVMPVGLLVLFVIELVGLFRGITNTGKALDFE